MKKRIIIIFLMILCEQSFSQDILDLYKNSYCSLEYYPITKCKTKIIMDGGKNITYTEKFKYDKTGNLISFSRYDKEGNKLLYQRYFYERHQRSTIEMRDEYDDIRILKFKEEKDKNNLYKIIAEHFYKENKIVEIFYEERYDKNKRLNRIYYGVAPYSSYRHVFLYKQEKIIETYQEYIGEASLFASVKNIHKYEYDNLGRLYQIKIYDEEVGKYDWQSDNNSGYFVEMHKKLSKMIVNKKPKIIIQYKY